ncbi:MAG: DEAD/DEAH box helicase [Candidatus Nanoarchaeia archaeon]
MLVTVTPRLYQQTILGTCVEKNTLVVLPTGMGKTLIAILLGAVRLRENPSGKILFVSPTRPLVEQHARTLNESTDLDSSKIVVFTGHIPAAKRAEKWKDASFVFSTPQGLENDVMGRRISLSDVSLFVFDEAHRAVGDYAYVYLAKKYLQDNPNGRLLALTASPGSDMEKIMEVVQNMHIEDLEIRTPDDPDVAPYIQEVEMAWLPVALPDDYKTTLKYLTDCYQNKLHDMKDLGYLKRVSMNKMELLKLQGALHGEMARGDRSFEIMKSISLLAEAMKISHGIELLESQGVSQLITYLEKLDTNALTSKTKAVKNLVKDIKFRSALVSAKKLRDDGVHHPKLGKLKEIVDGVVSDNSGAKLIVFTQYRDSANRIKEVLDSLAHVKSEVFVGQAKKAGERMSQKEQVAMLDSFREGGFNVLIATSVAEEGLDIPKVDEVVFYEPIPSAIRSIQRRGRTGRSAKGAVKVLMSKGTRDEAYRWSAHHKEKNMYRHLRQIGDNLKKKLANQQKLDTFAPKEDVAFLVDHRERGSYVMKHLIDKGVTLDLHQLALGDYQLSSRACVEFKTVPDFVQSIIDGRLMEQLVELKRNFSRPLLIIQGEEDMYSVRKVHPNAIRGVLGTITVKLGIPVLQTRTALETAELLLHIAKKEQEQFGKEFSPHGNKRPVTVKEQQEYIVSSLPGVGFGLAKPLLRKFKTLKKLFNSSNEELKEVEKIGDKKAEQLRSVFEKEWKE